FQELTTEPRRYGFHGTLKAPFALQGGTTVDELVAACAAFAAESASFALQGLSVNRLGQFLALTPNAAEQDLSAFAATCVRRFEPFRKPLSESDLERRRKSGLTPDQEHKLVEWGYPYIFEDFRFHMTLSNKLENEKEAATLEAAARAHFQDLTDRPRQVESLGLYCEAERGAPFLVHTIFPLTGTQTPDQSLSKCRGSK
ncbi:MAG: DUF1045 domain-containing protein, partial [Nisaea sp.]